MSVYPRCRTIVNLGIIDRVGLGMAGKIAVQPLRQRLAGQILADGPVQQRVLVAVEQGEEAGVQFEFEFLGFLFAVDVDDQAAFVAFSCPA